MHKERYTIKIIAGLALLVSGVLSTQISQSASAKSKDDFINQAMVMELATCYNDVYTNQTFSFVTGDNIYSKMLTNTGKSANVYLPFKTSPVSCQTIITDVKRNVLGNTSSVTDPTKYGYLFQSSSTANSGETPRKCMRIKYQYFDGAWKDNQTDLYCFTVNEDGSIANYTWKSGGGYSNMHPYSLNIVDSSNGFHLFFDDDKEEFWTTFIFDFNQKTSDANAWSTFVDKTNSELAKYAAKEPGKFSNGHVAEEPDPDYNETITDASYKKMTPRIKAINSFLQSISGDSSIVRDDYIFSAQDKVDLLSIYINEELAKSTGGAGLSLVIGDSSCWEDRASVTTTYAYPVSGRGWCELRNVDTVSGNDYVIFSNGTGNTFSGNKTFADVVSQFMSFSNSAGVSVPETSDPTSGGGNSGGSSGGQAEPICAKTSGVLSWLFCPVLSFVGETVGGIYEWVASSFLEVKSSFMDRTSGTYRGWAVFRNLANILFAIAFVVVILAQVTGIGLTNYNIKKILPRLIIVVVLVNLSYILCQLAVDISNIVGSRLDALLRGLGEDAFKFGETKNLVQGLVDGGVDAVGGILGVAGIVSIAAFTWDVWLPMLFLTLVGALIGVLFFFLTLGIRQAGVLIMVVLAPLAIVCYALPNTKTIFDKWWKVFSALLLVYPICGALMGGGNFAANLMVENAGGNFLYVLIAMLLTFVPFFFVPSILRNSLNGIGMLGAKLGQFGRGMQMRGRGAVARSEGFQDMQKQLRYGRAARAFRRQSAIRNSRVGQAVAGAAGAISQWSDTQSSNPAARVGKALTRGARAIGRPMAQASQRRFYRNAMSTLQRDRENAAAERLDATLEGENARQFALDVQSEEALYRSPDGGLNVENPEAVATEYRRELEAYMRNPRDRQRRARVTALQNILSGTDPGTERMQSTLTELAMANYGRSAAERASGEDALSRATRELNLGAMKAKSDTFAKMLTDFRQGQFGNFYSGGVGSYERTEKDEDGNDVVRTFNYARAYQDRANYSGASLASADDSARDQIIQGIQNGEMGGRTMANVVSAAEELLAGSENGTISAKGKDKTYARRILAAAYAHGATAHPASGSAVPTQGSTAMRNASTDAITRIASAAREQGSIITNEQLRNMAENARVALEDSGAEYTEEHAAALNDIINAAQERIELDASGNQVTDPGTGAPVHMRDLNGNEFHNVAASSATFRVKGAPQQFAAPSLPTGWVQEQRTTGKGKNKVTRMVWVDTSGVKKRVLSNDEAAYADQIQAIKQNFAVRNAEHGFIPTQPPPPGGGGGGGTP